MLISIIADVNKGGTFLTWTLHYLSGHETYFSCHDNENIELPVNVLTDVNAHGYKPNQPTTLAQFDEYFNSIRNIRTTSFHTFYFHRLKTVPVVITSTCPDTTKAVTQIQSTIDKVILLYNQPTHALYDINYQNRSIRYKLNSTVAVNRNDDEIHKDFIDTFFKESSLEWEKLGLTNTWDHREFLALNLRPFDPLSIIPNFDQTKKHYALDCFELFNNFDKTVVDLFDWLGLTINMSKWDHWSTVYQQWRELHTDRILFVEYFDIIIDSIINGYYLDLSRFKLDIMQEATIHHALIYRHGLTLKTWGLEKFPGNTQELHKLLEPNIYHDVEDIYGLLKRKSN